MARAVCARFDDVLPDRAHLRPGPLAPAAGAGAGGHRGGAGRGAAHHRRPRAARSAGGRLPSAATCRCIGALDPLVAALSRYLGARISTRVGRPARAGQRLFQPHGRPELRHRPRRRPGRRWSSWSRPTWCWCGVSRGPPRPRPASIWPTAACAPPTCRWCPGRTTRERLIELKNPLVVGLTVSPDRLMQIRRNRLRGLNERPRLRPISIMTRCARRSIKARRAFERRGWPTIDVTRRSVEETAAAILNLLSERRTRQRGDVW